MSFHENNSIDHIQSQLYQYKLKEKYKDLLLNPEPLVVCNEKSFDFISESLYNRQNSDETQENSSLFKISSHIMILRRVYIEDQDYPDFLLNLLEIYMMKELLNDHKSFIEKNDINKLSDKFNLQILSYRFFKPPSDKKVYTLDVLYLTHVNDENFININENNYCFQANEKKKRLENKFNFLVSHLIDLKQNYFESLDSFYGSLQFFKNSKSNEIKCFLSSDDSFQERNLRHIYIKPLYFMKKKLEERNLIPREYIWFLCCIGKRYHQLREVSLSLKIFEETYSLRSLEWGENTNETMDSLNRIACALLRKKKFKNLKEIFERVYRIRTNILGETNNIVAVSLYNLGIASLSSYNYGEACNYFNAAIIIYSKIFSKIKINYEIKLADCYQALGISLMKLKKYDESLKKFQESVRLNKINFEEPQMALKCGHIFNTIAFVYEQKKEPINGYIYLLKSFVLFNSIKGERKEVNEYNSRCKRFREENKDLKLLEIAFILKKKLKSIYKRNIIIEDILITFIK